MADFGKFRITNSGIDLEYKAQLGKELRFTKFKLGDGYYTGSIRALTDVVSEVMEVPIRKMDIQEISTTKKVTIGFAIDITTLTTGFYMREIGLYAKDPDTQEEVLVCYGNAGDTADYITPSASMSINEKAVNLGLSIDDVQNITAVIDSSLVYATQDDLEAFKLEIDGYAPNSKLVNLNANNWVLNSSTGYYEYNVTIENLTNKFYAICNLDIANQAKLKGKAYINTNNGYLTIYTTKKPTEDIAVNIMIWYTTEESVFEMSEEEVAELVNEYF